MIPGCFIEKNEIPDEFQSVLSEHTLDYDPESVGLIVDIALTLYEGLMEFSQKNKKEEKVTFKPRIDSIEKEEQLNSGENEIENLSNHRNEYNELKEWKNEEEHHMNELEHNDFQELIKDENEILNNLNNHRKDDDNEYYNFNNNSVAVKLSLDTESDVVQGFIFDIIKKDIVDRWKKEMFDDNNNTEDEQYGLNSDFPNIYTQSEAVFDAITINEVGDNFYIDPVAERSLGDDGIILNEIQTEKYKETKRIVSNEYEEKKFAKEPKRKVLRENEIKNSSEEPTTGLNKLKKRLRRRRKPPMFDRESGFSPPKRQQTRKEEEVEAELPIFPKKQSRKKLRTKPGRHKRKRFPGKKSVRRSQSKQNAVNRPPHLETLKLEKYQKEKLSLPKIQLHGRPLRVNSLINRL